ncbi:DTW domain-containing protein [Sulfurospirillum diekertiae]|uniref:tRNA-uridine aminocarboxypropyltransferase n=1 Tax=Sulfurospirillum diekertiae TaxID=1854492 RepID=A0A290HY84_9BACT|nr:tRNA-uridine aminocarboxypropyltransferase [Sulfurospirillum diekertiae]ATB70826.1 DTW domain protein [Sulfurospirillum diekertiae]QIR75895.1 DTW domain-containing protein [Sulfurospirillum diekertiae]QIR78535.1 DTW domain-containing protein [Sulfurospirillum diekertiae]
MQTIYGDRAKCYSCYRPKSSCMCSSIRPIETQTRFIVLMHPKEFKKTKNGTGHLTHLSLPNSELFMGIDFSDNARINEIIATHESFILYPSKHAINLSHHNPLAEKSLHVKKRMAIFLIDSTWACSLKMMRESKNLHALSHISFDATKRSEFKIKEQPLEYCLSTIESTLTVLELLNQWQIETIAQEKLETFLTPFHAMIDYQLHCIQNPLHQAVRFKPKKILTAL